MMGMKKPAFTSFSADEFASVCDGSFYPPAEANNGMKMYGAVKHMGAMVMGSIARKHPDLRILTMSPGGTTGTGGMRNMPFLMALFMNYVVMNLMQAFGKVHSLDTGARRLVDAIYGDDRFKSGHFYASVAPGVTGPVVDQAEYSPEFNDEKAQDNAYEAIHRFIG
jgi:hypothetical protein